LVESRLLYPAGKEASALAHAGRLAPQRDGKGQKSAGISVLEKKNNCISMDYNMRTPAPGWHKICKKDVNNTVRQGRQ